MLSTVSKLFERVLFNQLTKFVDKFLSPLLYGFRKKALNMQSSVNFRSDKGVVMNLTRLFVFY